MNGNGMLVVVSAPSGCGKDTVFKEIRKKRDDIVESVSATTRKPRDGEIDGVNYYFLSDFNHSVEFFLYAQSTRLELATSRVTGGCSNQLSYDCIFCALNYIFLCRHNLS